MTQVWVISTIALVSAAVLLRTGWWRLGFFLFAIRPSRMTVAKLGLVAKDPADIARIDEVLASFAGGFNAMITAPTEAKARAFCDSRSPLCQPFAHEGMAMGYCLRSLFRYRADEFEQRVVKPGPEFRYLYYVGLGFWSAMRHQSPSQLAKVVDGLDPLHRFLCYDGYGFKHAFFDHPKDPKAFHRFERIEGYAGNAAYQGVGRAFYFRFMADTDRLVDEMAQLGEYAADAASGVGLASVFVNPDRIELARTLAAAMPEHLRNDFHLGMCFGLKARSINDTEQFEGDVSKLDQDVQDAIFASVRECDRVELRVRAEGGADGYRQWRGLVTDWMASHIMYPMAGLVTSNRASPLTQLSASTQRRG